MIFCDLRVKLEKKFMKENMVSASHENNHVLDQMVNADNEEPPHNKSKSIVYQ